MTDGAFQLFGSDAGAGPSQGALVVLQDRQGRLVLNLRDDTPGLPHAGLWSLFGGGVDAGESLAEAAARELFEELGLAVKPAQLTPYAWAVSDHPSRRRLYVFTLILDLKPSDLRLGEGAGFGFFTAAQIGNLQMPKVLKPIINAFVIGAGN